jgi:hypothetical protein
MTTRRQARRHKGSTTRHRGLPWDASQRELVADDRQAAINELFGSEDSRETYEHWQHVLGPQATYVYFIRSTTQREIKIGYAANPLTRIRELQCGNPSPLRISALILGSKVTERILHRHWREVRLAGEWFAGEYGSPIVGLAEDIALLQISEHRKGRDLQYVRDMLPAQILEAA